MHDVAWASGGEIAGAVSRGEVSALAVIEATLLRISERNRALNAFTAVTAERARDKAHAIDVARAGGRALGPLAGAPFAVKNLFDVAGLATLAGARINRDRAPAARDATLIERLEAAGARVAGAPHHRRITLFFYREDRPLRTPPPPHSAPSPDRAVSPLV